MVSLLILFRLGYVSFPYPWKLFLLYPRAWDSPLLAVRASAIRCSPAEGCFLFFFFFFSSSSCLSALSTDCKTLTHTVHYTHTRKIPRPAQSPPNQHSQDGLYWDIPHLLPRLLHPLTRKTPDSCEQRRPTQRHKAF